MCQMPPATEAPSLHRNIGGNTTTETRNHSVSDHFTSIAGIAAVHDAKRNLTESKTNSKEYEVSYQANRESGLF